MDTCHIEEGVKMIFNSVGNLYNVTAVMDNIWHRDTRQI